ncbi:MAG: orotidine-5'-phosphate decarboxylase [Microbacteriaceae bacterium]|nr:orotidine-5'-phosphate decarboxylase [Microbacteriaceae bacterium]
MPETFAQRAVAAIAAHGRLCAGVDPHGSLLAEWGLPDTADGARSFGLRVVDAAAGRTSALKPQVAFFERHGASGYRALEDVLAAARAAGLLVIADVKRGDIGTTLDAYAEAWLTPGSPLEADAMTAVAYQGLGSLDGAIARAEAAGKGVLVLAATSNPEAVATQTATRADGRTVAAGVVADALARSSGALGFVIGATVRVADYGIDPADLAGVPVLAPGFGAQGTALGELDERFGVAAPTTFAHVSRSVLGAGPDGLGDALDRAREEVGA